MLSMWLRACFLWFAAVAVTASGELLPSTLSTGAELARAAEAAGFRVEAVAADLPVAVRPRFPFTTFDYGDPVLSALREEFPLEDLVRDTQDEWTAQLRLKDWVFRQIPGGTPKSSPRTAPEILRLAAQGERFWCTYYAITYTEAAHALGWQARKIGVDRKHGPEGMGSTHHGAVEIWSNRFRKWVLIDAQSNLHFEKEGMPLSAWEVRAEWLKDRGARVDHVVGAPPHTRKQNPAMVWSVPDEDEIATYYWLYIETNADEIWYQNGSAAGSGRVHIGYTKNQFLPTQRVEDAYWTVGVVEAQIVASKDRVIRLRLDSYCPNLEAFQVSRDGATWQNAQDPASVEWPLQAGWNTLRLRTIGSRGVTGPETSLVLRLENATDARTSK